MCDRPNGERCREDAMVVLYHDGNGRPKVWCDPCIVPLVRALNEGRIATIASCCGHGRRPSRISLADGRCALVMPYDEANRIRGLWPGINDELPTLTLSEVDR